MQHICASFYRAPKCLAERSKTSQSTTSKDESSKEKRPFALLNVF